jgi:tRNA(Ile)-lysidine synthetase-like protein
MDPRETVAAFLARHAQKSARKRLLVAVSGGADSVALLCAAAAVAPKAAWSVGALHADHGLRGRQSAADARFVRALCGRLGVELRLFATRLEPGAALEERARNWRRACYAEAAREKGASWVLLGHHARDQAETVLLNLVRGSGTAGAAGMPAWDRLNPQSPAVRLGRPFLNLRPEALRDWLKSQGQTWREDASNRDLAFVRNRLRHQVLPLLESINPRAVEHLAAFAADLAPTKRPDHLAGLLRLDRAAQKRAQALLQKGSGQTDLGRGWILQMGPAGAEVLAPDSKVKLEIGETHWADWIFELKLAQPTDRMLKKDDAFWFSPELLDSGFKLRLLKPGDRLTPFGFQGRRKAADLLREAGVPEKERSAWPVVEAQGRPLAIPGVRRGTGFPAVPGMQALRLGWRKTRMDKTSLQ